MHIILIVFHFTRKQNLNCHQKCYIFPTKGLCKYDNT